MGHHDRISPSHLLSEDLDPSPHTQHDPASDHHRPASCPPSDPAWNQSAASYSSPPIPSPPKADDDTPNTSAMQEQPSDYKNAAATGYQSGNTSNTTTKGRVAGLTVRHHQPTQDATRKNNDRQQQQQPRSRPKSADFSYRRSGVDSMSRVSGAEFVRQTSTSAAPTIAAFAGSKTSRPSGSGPQHKGLSLAQQRRRASLLRVRIERGLMVGMACLAGYRMMTLDYGNTQDKDGSAASTSWGDSSRQSHHHHPKLQQESQRGAIPRLARSAGMLGAGLLLLALIHALFLIAHDRQLQFPLHNKNLPLQPLRKRSSRGLNANASQAVAAAAVAAESDDDSEDDEALQRDINAELQQESLLLSQESTSSNGVMGEPALGGWQSRFCWSAESAVPQWRVWGSEAHWYRKGADNGSIFATVLVPIVLAAKFVQTVTDEKSLPTGTTGLRTAETVLSSIAFSLIFGTSILLHMLLLKVFDQIGAGSKHPHHPRKDSTGASRSTILDSIFLPSAMTTSSTLSTSMSANNLSASSSLYPKYLQPLHRQQKGISSPSSPSSPSFSTASSAPSLLLLDPQSPQQQQQQYQRQQEIQDAFVFSADQLHHPSMLAGTSEIDKSSDREEIWIIAIGFGGAFTFLFTCLARFKCIPGLENTGAGMVMLIQTVFQVLMIGFAYFYRRSFTFGELAVLAQVVTLLIHEALIVNFVTPPPAPGAVLEHPQFMFLLTLVVGMLLVGVLLCPVLMYCRRLAQMPTKGASPANLRMREFKKKVAAGVIYSGLAAIVLGVIMPRCQRVLGQNPFLWLIEFILMTRIFTTMPQLELPGQSPVTSLATTNFTDAKFGLETLMGARIGWSRLGLCLYWIMAVGLSIAFFYWMNTSIRRRSIMGSLNNRRKYYHALAVLMFIPGYLTDEPFMHIAFSVGLASLIFLEYIRYFAVVPFGKEIHLFLVGFLDARDGGPIILSHLYLLMGCAVPVWLAEQHILAGLSGIFALGVGDAMASIVGKRFGRHRWPGTIKTVEGTVAFVVSVMVAAGAVFVGMWLMSFVFGDSSRISSSASMISSSPSLAVGSKALPSSMPPAALLSFSTWNDWLAVSWSVWGVIRYGMAVSVAAMLEAVSEQNDNLVIPVVMLAMVWLV